MQKNIQLNINKADKREVNYFKKYNKKIRLLKAIILAIFLVFILIVGRKMVILVTLSEKAEKSKETDNYYLRYAQYEGDKMTISETYKKGEKKITTLNHYDNKNPEYKSKWIEFYNGNKTNTYVETNDDKIALLSTEQETFFPPMLVAYSEVHIENVWQLIQNSLLSSVRTIRCNGKECYYFSNFQGSSKIGSEVGYRSLY